MITEIKDSLVNELQKRFKNPFLGAFIISWVFFNWDFLYVTLFLDEKYVSLIPTTKDIFYTKFEYIKSKELVNINKFLFFPLASTFGVIIFIEWITTTINLFISNVKNKILGYELLTKDESLKYKNDLVESKSENNKIITGKNDELLSLQGKVSELELKIDEKVSEKLKISERKNIERINELEDNLSKSEIISSERLNNNKRLELVNKELTKIINDGKTIENNLLKEKENLIKDNKELNSKNLELNKRLSDIDIPLDEKYKLEYNDFKNSSFFNSFGHIIDEIEGDPYNLSSKFYGKEIKYLKLKGIIVEFPDDYNKFKYEFTQKGDKFVEYYLDEYDNSNDTSNDISVDDIPF